MISDMLLSLRYNYNYLIQLLGYAFKNQAARPIGHVVCFLLNTTLFVPDAVEIGLHTRVVVVGFFN